MEAVAPFVSFAASFTVVVALIGTQRIHGLFTHDSDIGVQKLHEVPTPRVGGVAIAVGAGVGGLFLPPEYLQLWLVLCLTGSIAFSAGLLEDVTKKVGAKWRLLATVGAGFLFSQFSGYRIERVDLPIADSLLSVEWFSIVFTAIAIGGFANAINLIDGVNGLASGTAIIILSSLSVIAARAGDVEMMTFCLLTAGALAGFFLLNFPLGKIFLGDSGAYAVGFMLAAIAIMLPMRNPQLSPLMALLALSYPVIETGSSIWRRVSRGHSPGRPDRLHLHSLVYRSSARRLSRAIGMPQMRNAATSVILWGLPLLSAALTQLSAWNPYLALPAIGIMILAYASHYRRVALLGPSQTISLQTLSNVVRPVVPMHVRQSAPTFKRTGQRVRPGNLVKPQAPTSHRAPSRRRAPIDRSAET